MQSGATKPQQHEVAGKVCKAERRKHIGHHNTAGRTLTRMDAVLRNHTSADPLWVLMITAAEVDESQPKARFRC